MAIKKKYAKGRLDKYYHMAKEQGYRARSAFKLIQLNKKFNFLENAKVCVDLCAAPGGWLQVAAKYMPKPSIIIGLDLVPIAPIPGVMTFTEDITTSKCRATLKKELQTWKADVFLHDGAPNVGTSWIQDAFFQSQLTLSALKLATEFLMPGGTFITKVFRSKDYNKLMWVFNQLFSRVEATKPSSSRNVSAEIFVVCRDYLAPKKIDSRILDPSFVFKEVDDTLIDGDDSEKKVKERQGAVINNIFHPEKKRRHRDGYDDGDYTLFSSTPVSEFVESPEFLEILARSTTLSFTESDECQRIKKHALTTDDIKACCQDLKVVGKKDFKALIKWRESLRIDLGLTKSRKQIMEEKKKAEEDAMNESENELTIEEKLTAQAEALQMHLRKTKKKQRERKAKELLKLRLGMDTPQDIGLEASENLGVGDFDFDEFNAPMTGDVSDGSSVNNEDDEDVSGEESDLNVYDSDEETALKIGALDDEMEGLFSEFLSKRSKKNAKEVVKNSKEGSKEFEEWYGLEFDKQLDENAEDKNSDGESSSFSSTDDSEGEDTGDANESNKLSEKAKIFFDNPVFKSLSANTEKSMFGKDLDDDEDSEEENIFKNARAKAKAQKRKRHENEENDLKKELELVPLEEAPSDVDDDYAIQTAQEYTIAQQLIRASGKRDLIDKAFNRYSFNDPDLPSWFTQDEDKHNKPSLPVTKQAVEIMKQRAMALDARPIRKIAEAKFRKKTRALRRIEKMMKKAETMNNEEDMSEKSKLSKIASMMQKAKSANAKVREKPKLVVAKGMNRGAKGRPNGVKGRYKMVDPRMKKEVRADKRKAKKSSKRR